MPAYKCACGSTNGVIVTATGARIPGCGDCRHRARAARPPTEAEIERWRERLNRAACQRPGTAWLFTSSLVTDGVVAGIPRDMIQQAVREAIAQEGAAPELREFENRTLAKLLKPGSKRSARRLDA